MTPPTPPPPPPGLADPPPYPPPPSVDGTGVGRGAGRGAGAGAVVVGWGDSATTVGVADGDLPPSRPSGEAGLHSADLLPQAAAA